MIPLIFGYITFLDPILDGQQKAIVHSIDEVVQCENSERAEILGEEGLETHDAYLIPSEYSGEIVYECEKPEAIK